MPAVCSFSLSCSREIQVWWFYDFFLFIALSEDTSHHDEVLEILNHSHEQIWVHKLHIMMNLTNFSVHAWLDFNDTLSVIQSCQLVTLHHNANFLLLNYNLSNRSNYYDLTEYNLQYQDTSCSQVCNDIKSLFDPYTFNLEMCGLWLSTDGSALFAAVKLHNIMNENALTYQKTISTCLQQFDIKVKVTSNINVSNTLFSVTCTKNALFNQVKKSTTVNSLYSCLQTLCSSTRLNQNLAEIRVSSPQFTSCNQHRHLIVIIIIC